MPLGAFKAALMGTAGVSTEGDVVLLATTTASSDASISFTSDIDSTYGEYIFRFYDMNPEYTSGATQLTFQCSIDGGSNYNVAQTSTSFYANHQEDDTDTTFPANSGMSQDTSTDNALTQSQGYGADECSAGELHLFNPSSTTYAKHFYSETNGVRDPAGVSAWSVHFFRSGYYNTTSAINAVRFQFNYGDMDGKIKMWGVK